MRNEDKEARIVQSKNPKTRLPILVDDLNVHRDVTEVADSIVAAEKAGWFKHPVQQREVFREED